MQPSDEPIDKVGASRDEIEAQVTKMLRKIGWDASDLKQIEVYANMPPARKVEQMFRIRDSYVRLLRARLLREHPDLSKTELDQLLQEHLDLVREDKTFG